MKLRVRSLGVDTSPLRMSRDFRLLWGGNLISETGQQITQVAILIQVFRLTNSPGAVGLVGLAELVPLMVTTLASGPLVDRLDRRKILLATQFGYVVASSILLGSALIPRPPLGLIYGAAALSAGVRGIVIPTRNAMIPSLVGQERVAAAIALNQVVWSATAIAGPALAGLVVAQLGLAWAYGLDVASFAATIVAASLMRPRPPITQPGREERGLRAILEGLRYLRGRPVLQSTFVVDLVATVFGLPRALFPVLAAVQFHRGPEVVGALFSSMAVGALIAALTTGWVSRVRRQGLAVIVAVTIWGAGITLFGLAGSHLWLALGCLAVAGAADIISAVFRGTILQVSVPDSLRGRLSAVYVLVVVGGPRLGDIEAGLVAEAFTPTISVVTGGLATMAGAVLMGAFVRSFRRYDASAVPSLDVAAPAPVPAGPTDDEAGGESPG